MNRLRFVEYGAWVERQLPMDVAVNRRQKQQELQRRRGIIIDCTNDFTKSLQPLGERRKRARRSGEGRKLIIQSNAFSTTKNINASETRVLSRDWRQYLPCCTRRVCTSFSEEKHDRSGGNVSGNDNDNRHENESRPTNDY